jgi:subtilisin family serine protease
MPSAADRAAGEIPSYRLGGDGGTLRAAGGQRYVVMVESATVLDRLLDGDGTTFDLAPVDVWDGAVFGFTAYLDETEAALLASVRGVDSIEIDRRVEAADAQSNPPWGLDRIDQVALPLDATYSYARTGLGVTAYVIDSGIWLTHTQFAGRIPYGAWWDFGDGTEAWDCNGHGTHVSGILGGSTYGVAKQVTIVPVKTLDCSGGGPISATVQAIDWIVQDHEAGVPAVANMSVGGPASPAVDAAVNALIADGITVVAAAGNEAEDSCTHSPGRTPAAITVAASTSADDDADFSNFGPCNDLFAPGVDIMSSWAGSDTATNTISGTSMASPHVAGAAALFLQGAPTSSPAEVWNAIDQASTKGALSLCSGDPDKLLFVSQTQPPPSAPAPAPCPPPAPTTSTLATVQPARLYDSRQGPGPRPAGSITEVQVRGQAGVPIDAAIAALNVTALQPDQAGYMTVFPCGTTPPNASNLNYRAQQTIPNAAAVAIGVNGRVCVFTSATAGLLVDVTGYTLAGAPIDALNPFRLFDSRSSSGPRPAGSITEVQVTGVGGVAADATAAMLNVTAVDAASGGYMTVYPCGGAVPLASNLNVQGGQTVANAVLGRIGAGGRVCVFTSMTAGLIVDVNAAVRTGATLAAVDPFRLLDTRQLAGPASAGSTTTVQVAGVGGVPPSATTALLNVTVLEASADGYVTVYPCGAAQPNSSNLNFAAGDTIPNAVIVKLGAGGTICVFTSAAAGLLVDVNGSAA